MHQLVEVQHFLLNLVFSTEDVTIVLGKAAHAHDAVQATCGLIAVALTKLAKTQRQVAIALHTLLEDQNVAWAVHGLQGIVTLFGLGHEHVVAVLVPVTRLLPQGPVQNLRCLDLFIAIVAVDGAHVLLHLLPHTPALGVPENGTR